MAELKELETSIKIGNLESRRQLTKVKQQTFDLLTESAGEVTKTFDRVTGEAAASQLENFMITESPSTTPEKWEEKFNELSQKKAQSLNPIQRTIFNDANQKTKDKIRVLAEKEELKNKANSIVTGVINDISNKTNTYAAELAAGGFTEEGYTDWQNMFSKHEQELPGKDMSKIKSQAVEGLFNSLLFTNQFDSAAIVLNKNMNQFEPTKQRTLVSALESRMKVANSVEGSGLKTNEQQAYKQMVLGTLNDSTIAMAERNGLKDEYSLANLIGMATPELYAVQNEMLQNGIGTVDGLNYITDRIHAIQSDLSNENIFQHYNMVLPARVDFNPAILQNGSETMVNYELLQQIINNDLLGVTELGQITSDLTGSDVSGVSLDQKKLLRQGLDFITSNQKIDLFKQIDNYPRGHTLLKEVMSPREWEMRKLKYNDASSFAEKSYDAYMTDTNSQQQSEDRQILNQTLLNNYGISLRIGDYEGLTQLVLGSKKRLLEKGTGDQVPITQSDIKSFMNNYHLEDTEFGQVLIPGEERKPSTFEKVAGFLSKPFGTKEGEEQPEYSKSTVDSYLDMYTFGEKGFAVEPTEMEQFPDAPPAEPQDTDLSEGLNLEESFGQVEETLKQKRDLERSPERRESNLQQAREALKQSRSEESFSERLSNAEAFFEPISSSEYRVKYFNNAGQAVTLTDSSYRPLVINTDQGTHVSFSDTIIFDANKEPLRTRSYLSAVAIKYAESLTRTQGDNIGDLTGLQFRSWVKARSEEVRLEEEAFDISRPVSGFATEAAGMVTNPIDLNFLSRSYTLAGIAAKPIRGAAKKIVEHAIGFGTYEATRHLFQAAEQGEKLSNEDLANSFAGGALMGGLFAGGIAGVVGIRGKAGRIFKKRKLTKKQQEIEEKLRKASPETESSSQEDFLKGEK